MNIHVREGRLTEKKGEIVISQSALDDGAKISIGDTVKAEYFDRTVTGLRYSLVAIVLLPLEMGHVEIGILDRVQSL